MTVDQAIQIIRDHGERVVEDGQSYGHWWVYVSSDFKMLLHAKALVLHAQHHLDDDADPDRWLYEPPLKESA